MKQIGSVHAQTAAVHRCEAFQMLSTFEQLRINGKLVMSDGKPVYIPA